MLYVRKVNRTGERELKKPLSSHLCPGFCPTRRSVNMLSEGHSIVHYESCKFTFEGKKKADFVPPCAGACVREKANSCNAHPEVIANLEATNKRNKRKYVSEMKVDVIGTR